MSTALTVAAEEQHDGPPRAPTGLCHAFSDGVGRTLCGEPLAHLWVFGDVDFTAPFLDHCRTCQTLARALI